MRDDRVIELVRWGPCYAKPAPKNHAEYATACRLIRERPHLWKEITWTSSSTAAGT